MRQRLNRPSVGRLDRTAKSNRGRPYCLIAATLLGLVLLVVLLVPFSPARAAFPGENGLIAFTRGLDQIWVVEADGSNARELIGGSAPVWSPDGKRMAFVRHGVGEEDPPEIWVADADGSHAERVSSGRAPTWSPDGDSIAFIRVREVDERAGAPVDCGEVWIAAPDGSDERRLVGSTRFPRDLDWAPTDGEIALVAETPDTVPVCEEGVGGLVIVGEDGELKRQLALQSEPMSVSWSPDGKTLAFHDRGDHVSDNLWLVPSAGDQPRRLLVGPADHFCGNDVCAASPRWSPDGEKLVYTAVTDPLEEHPDLWVTDTEGATRERLVFTGRAPDWQPLPGRVSASSGDGAGASMGGEDKARSVRDESIGTDVPWALVGATTVAVLLLVGAVIVWTRRA